MTAARPQTAMPVIAGVLILVSEGFKLLGALGFGLFVIVSPRTGLFLTAAGVILLALTVVAVLGGIFALQRRNWGVALAGAIIATLPFSPLGLVALILVAVSKGEFR